MRLAPEAAVAANDVDKKSAQSEMLEDAQRRGQGLVGQHGERTGLEQQRQHLGHAVIRHGVVQQAPVVDVEEAGQRARGVDGQLSAGQRARHQDRGAVADHGLHLGLAQGCRAVRLHQV